MATRQAGRPLSDAELRALLRLGRGLSDLPAELLPLDTRRSIRASLRPVTEEYVARLPDDPRQRMVAARFLYDQGFLEAEVALLEAEVGRLERGSRAVSDKADVWEVLAQALGVLGQEERALQCLDTAESLFSTLSDPTLRAFHEIVCEAQRVTRSISVGRPDQALTHFRRIEDALPLNPDRPQLVLLKTLSEVKVFQAGAGPEAVEAILGGLGDVSRLDTELGVILAIAHLKQANHGAFDLEESLRGIRRALVFQAPGVPRASGLNEWGETLVLAGRIPEARGVCEELKRCVAEMPGESWATKRWALAALSMDAILARKEGADESAQRERLEVLETEYAGMLAGHAGMSIPATKGLFFFTVELALPSAIVWGHLLLGDGPERALAPALAMQSLHDLARARNLPAPTLSELRRDFLEPGHGLLLYLPAQPLAGESLVFAVDREEVLWAPIGDTYAWERNLRDLSARFALPSRSSGAEERTRAEEEAVRAARRLGNVFLPPRIAERVARWERVTVVGADVFGELPFDGLEVEGIGPLGLAKEIDHVPSLAWALGCARTLPRPQQPRRSLVISSAALAAIDPPLWNQLLERDWAGVLQREDTLTFGGGDAGKLADVQRGTFDVVSILAHGGHDERTLAPTIRLGDQAGAIVAFDAVERLPRARVFLLGTCGASSGSVLRMNAGMSHFGGTLLGQGAECVVLGMGDLPLAPTSALLGRTHGELLQGASPAAALRTARRALVAAGFTHPGNYAGMKAYGLGQRGP